MADSGTGNRIAALFMALAIAVTAAGCTAPVEDRQFSQYATDAEIKLDLNKRLLGGKYRDLFLDVSTDVHEGRVMLTGSVKTREDKNRVSALAQNITGVRTIYNDVQVTDEGGFTNTANDVWIETKIKARLVAEKGVRSVNLRWQAVNGVVYVIGRVRDEAEMARVMTVLRDIDHVTNIVNHIVIKPAPPET